MYPESKDSSGSNLETTMADDNADPPTPRPRRSLFRRSIASLRKNLRQKPSKADIQAAIAESDSAEAEVPGACPADCSCRADIATLQQELHRLHMMIKDRQLNKPSFTSYQDSMESLERDLVLQPYDCPTDCSCRAEIASLSKRIDKIIASYNTDMPALERSIARLVDSFPAASGEGHDNGAMRRSRHTRGVEGDVLAEYQQYDEGLSQILEREEREQSEGLQEGRRDGHGDQHEGVRAQGRRGNLAEDEERAQDSPGANSQWPLQEEFEEEVSELTAAGAF